MTVIPNSSVSQFSSRISRWHYLAVAFFVFQATGAFSAIDRLKYGQWAGKTGGDDFTQFLNTLQILVSIFLFWVGYNRSRRIGLGGTILLALVAFMFMSVLWSVDPQTSLRRAVVYLFFLLGVIGIANSLNGDEYMQLMRRLVFLSAIASLVLLLISPAYALMSDGAMQGIFSHKNVLGQVMAAGVLASLHGLRVGDGRRWSCAATLMVFVGIGFAARSATSLMTIFVFCGAEILFALSRWGGSAARIAIIIVCMPVLVIFVLSPDLILGLLGKDATLTGRTELWELVDICISKRPLFGWGFEAFWSPTNPTANEISTSLGWVVPQAHNGLRELLLQLGVVGTSLFAIFFVRSIWIATRCLRTPARELGRSLMLCCGGILLVGVSEEVLVDPAQISAGMLFVMALIGERMLRPVAHAQRFRSVIPPLRPTSARGPAL